MIDPLEVVEKTQGEFQSLLEIEPNLCGRCVHVGIVLYTIVHLEAVEHDDPAVAAQIAGLRLRLLAEVRHGQRPAMPS